MYVLQLHSYTRCNVTKTTQRYPPTHAQRVHAFRNREQLRLHHAQKRRARMNLVRWSPLHHLQL